jgi:hypothetical protein
MLALAVVSLLLAAPVAARAAQAPGPRPPFLAAPIWVYNNWSAYDELSDGVPLTESLAMRELQEMVRLRKEGVQLDYYVMDAFWFDPDGGYRIWRKADWPDGPDAWLAACKANGVTPGLWFSTNTLVHIKAAPEWRDSLNKTGDAMALYAGGFLPDFMAVLQHWYDRGVRIFKLDFADFGAAVAGDETRLPPAEIKRRNVEALRAALDDFRRRNPDAVLVAFNGFAGDVSDPHGEIKDEDLRWLETFDSLYAGDPRPSNVPQMNFFRSVDIYSDRMVRHFEEAGVPLPRIDATSFMIGDTGTIYGRGTEGWHGMLLLTLARGGWINTIHGKLEFLDTEKARWFAKAQAMYAPLQHKGVTRSFGSRAGDARPYGFGSGDAGGSLYVVVNPGDEVQPIALPALAHDGPPRRDGRILFRDPGFTPELEGDTVRLGPGELALVGFGRYADAGYDLGTGSDIHIPRVTERLATTFAAASGPGTAIAASIPAPRRGDVRVVLRQRDTADAAQRSFSKASMGDVFAISATQEGHDLPVEIHYDRIIWSGLAWAVGEIRRDAFEPGKPIELRLSSKESDPELHLDGRVYVVEY